MMHFFIDYIEEERRYSPLTIKKYQRDLEFFGLYLSHDEGVCFDHDLVTSDDIKGWIMFQRNTGLSPTSINGRLCSLRSYYRWLLRENHVEIDPTMKISALKSDKKLPSFIPESEMLKLFNNLQTLVNESADKERYEVFRDVVLILLIYATGIRRSEVAGLHINDFEDNYSRIRIVGKGDKTRIVPLLSAMKENVERLIQVLYSRKICKSANDFLFLTTEGKTLNSMDIYTIVRRRLKQVGIQGKTSPHVLRHTFATHMMNGGADMRTIQELLGHSSLKTTQVYTHNSVAELKKVYNKAHPRARKP